MGRLRSIAGSEARELLFHGRRQQPLYFSSPTLVSIDVGISCGSVNSRFRLAVPQMTGFLEQSVVVLHPKIDYVPDRLDQFRLAGVGFDSVC